MRTTKLLIAAILVISPFAAQAVPIEFTVGFDGNYGPFNVTESPTGGGLNITNSGNCPNVSPDVGAPCAQFNANNDVTFDLGGGVFDLIDFYWRSTGGQQNSDMAITYTFLGDMITEVFGNFPGTQNVDDSILAAVNLLGITSVTFFNNSNSVTRVDNIRFGYDSGLCTNEPCDPVSVPEPGTLALLGMGLLGMGLLRRRKTAL